MQPARLILTDSDDPIDRQHRREAPDTGGERSEHAELGAIVAIVGVERVADEAAIAGPRTEQANLSLELNGRGGQQRNVEFDTSVADGQPGGEIVSAVYHQVVVGEELLRVVGVDPRLNGCSLHVAVQPLNELKREIGFRVAGVALAKERLPMQI